MSIVSLWSVESIQLTGNVLQRGIASADLISLPVGSCEIHLLSVYCVLQLQSGAGACVAVVCELSKDLQHV
jgi:hypothetical protein